MNRPTILANVKCSLSLLLVVGSAACTASGPAPTPTSAVSPSSRPTLDTTPAASGSAAATASVTATPRAAPAGLTAERLAVLGGPPDLHYTILMPEAWQVIVEDHFASFRSETFVAGFSAWIVGRVPADACKWRTTMASPGPSVPELATALHAQAHRNATAPRQVTLAGLPATSIEWSVPATWVVTGDSDFEGCDAQGNSHKDFVSWLGRGGGERYQQVAGQVDQLWIIEVNGERVVLDATYAPGASRAVVNDLHEIAESIQFEIQ